MYTAIVLDENTRQMILGIVFRDTPLPPSGWVMKCHHVTVNMGPFDRSLQHHDLMLDELCEGGIANVLDLRDEGVIAVGVYALGQNYWASGRSDLVGVDCPEGERFASVPIKTINEIPHITLAHRIDVKPRTVNDYPDSWEEKHIGVMSGTLMEVAPATEHIQAR